MEINPAENLETLAATWSKTKSEDQLRALWGGAYRLLKAHFDGHREILGEGNRRKGSVHDIPAMVTLEVFRRPDRLAAWDPQDFAPNLFRRAYDRIKDIRTPHKKFGGSIDAGETPREYDAGSSLQPENGLLERELSAERRQLLARALATYRGISNAEDRRVFWRVYIQGQSFAALALQLGRSAQTLKNRQFRLFERVAARMGVKRVRRGA